MLEYTYICMYHVHFNTLEVNTIYICMHEETIIYGTLNLYSILNISIEKVTLKETH